MKIITFVIPSFNVEYYLKKVLDSFLAPEIIEQLEVIIVDDGSCDGTADIAKMYAEKYPEIYRLLQKENGGHGSTINLGSKEARGKYFKVIDADDWVVTENLSEYIQCLTKSDAEVILTPFHMVDMITGERIVQKMYIEDYSRCYTPDEIAERWKSFDRCTTFHGITYRTDFYNEHRHELSENVFYEDQEYATIPFCYAKKVAVLNLNIYQYLIGNSEQSVSSANKIKRIGHLETVIEHMLEYWSVHKNNSSFARNYFLRKMEGIVFSYYVIMCIITPQKSVGRRHCKNLNCKIQRCCPELFEIVHNKYFAYIVFSIFRINENTYEKIIHSSLFRLVRRNHKIEKE